MNLDEANASADAFAAKVAGGRFEFLDDAGQVLATWELGAPAFHPAVAGVLSSANPPKTEVIRSGEIVAFHIRTANGEVIERGPAGDRAGAVFPIGPHVTKGQPL